MNFKKLEVWLQDNVTESHCDELYKEFENVNVEFTEFDTIIEAKCIDNTVLTSLYRPSLNFIVEFERNSIKIIGTLNEGKYKNVPVWWILSNL